LESIETYKTNTKSLHRFLKAVGGCYNHSGDMAMSLLTHQRSSPQKHLLPLKSL